MSSISRKERRTKWWKQNKKQVESSTDDDGNSNIKPKKFTKMQQKIKKPEQELATEAEPETKSTEEHDENKKKSRFLIFVGNIPFDLTKDDVKKHFRCTGSNIVDFRLMTKKTTGSSKGCGFLELDNYKSYEKALNLHHSTLGGRKINVEVTCGGGGSGEKRKARLKERKNEFQKKRAKKHVTKKTKKSKDNCDVEIKKDSVKSEEKTEIREKKKKSKKRKLESAEDETFKKKKALENSAAKEAMDK